MAHKDRVIKIKSKSGGMGAIKVRKRKGSIPLKRKKLIEDVDRADVIASAKKLEKKKEVYENPYFGKKKNNTAGSATWDSSHVYGFGKGKAKGGRAGFQHGGRTDLLEELGRVEGEHSNRNRRAEVSRIHGELNKGYKHGGPVGAAKRGFNKKILRKD